MNDKPDQSVKTNFIANGKSPNPPSAMYRKVLVITVLFVLIATVCLFAYLNIVDFEKVLIGKTQEHLKTIAESEGRNVAFFLTDTQAELKLIAQNPVLQDRLANGEMIVNEPQEGLYSLEKMLYEHIHPRVDSIYWIDEKGIVQNRTPWKHGKAGSDYSLKPGVKAVMETRKPVISDVFESDSGIKCLSICYPVFKDKQFIGLMRALVHTSALEQILGEFHIGNRGYAWLLNNRGQIISHPNRSLIGENLYDLRKRGDDGDEDAEDRMVETILSGKGGEGVFAFDEISSERNLNVWTPVKVDKANWSLVVSVNYDEISRPIKAHSCQLLGGVLLITIALAGAGFGLYRSELKKAELAAVSKTTEQLRHINEKLQRQVADRKIAEEKAMIMTEKAIAASAAKSEFIARMSHEIRTPMNAVIGFTGLLAEEDINARQLEYVESIQNGAEHLLTIINDVLDFSKIEAGKMETEIVACSLVNLLDGVESIMRPMAVQKELEFEIFRSPELPKMIRTDSVRVRQCLINLVNNALKFTEKGHVYVNVSLHTKDDRQFVRFDVEDTGIGIPPDMLDNIFKSFTQTDNTHTRKYGGTGLGLAITTDLAQLLDGSLSVKSEVTTGSVFTLLIPANISKITEEQCDDLNTGRRENEKANLSIEPLSGRVLVAEDSHANQVLVRALLERLGLEVAIAEDGRIALAKAIEESFDLILMDVQMPNMNGLEATRAIREKGIDVPIVAFTARAMKGDAERCFAAGCNDYLTKPVDRRKLHLVVQKYLNSKNTPKPWTSDSKNQKNELCIDKTEKKNDCYDNGHDDSKEQILVKWENAIRFCGDEEVIKRVANSILKDGPACIEEIADAIDLGDSKRILLYAHRLRGSALTIGIDILAEVAGKIEIAAQENDLIRTASLLDDLRCKYQRTTNFLQRDDWVEISMADSCQKIANGKRSDDSSCDC